MASAQHAGRRRDSLSRDDDVEMRPQKKQKLDDLPATKSTATGKQTNGKKAAPKKTTNSYDEEAEGGFTFSRRAKKSAAPQAALPQQQPQPQPQRQDRASAASDKKKKTSLERENVPNSEQPTRRRSARLSGESVLDIAKAQRRTEMEGKDKKSSSEQQQQQQQQQASSSSPARARQAMKPTTPGDQQLHVPKKNRTTKIALPFADTPVIDRNKEMRKTSSEARRRSSGSLRGRRASSLMENGGSNAVPHDEVKTEDFYKHVSQDLPEPRRMRQLLIWCGHRGLAPKPASISKDTSAILAARTIQEELLKDFQEKSEMSDWFNRQEIVKPTMLVKKQNPRNVDNARRLHELQTEVERLQTQKSSWEELFTSLTSLSWLDKSGESQESTAPIAASIRSNVLDEPDQGPCLNTIRSGHDIVESTGSRLRKATDSLEFKIDSFAKGVHDAERLQEVVHEMADRVLGQASQALEKREVDTLQKHGTERIGPGDLLKALSRTRR